MHAFIVKFTLGGRRYRANAIGHSAAEVINRLQDLYGIPAGTTYSALCRRPA